MNLQSERLSVTEMKERQKQMLGKAESVMSTVAVMEPNWRAMIASQELQVATLTDIFTRLDTLTTKEALADFMNQQLAFLMTEQAAMKKISEEYQAEMQKQAKETNLSLKTTASNLESQAGRMQEQFGKALMQEQENLDKHTKKLFRICLIPSLILLLLEVMPHIWPLIFSI